uniref:1-alkyl-2-acetylglycerophosphocholine esterase n=1 Tax=Chromera velia CCMP2878 TaxID=1169474 RepID=A0A0G4GCI7_9ALVE|eukprot:Cvel_21243.t1-p1 / transcript=Cvel_21243.t1 / gene=Cvel_21243 / organism=Chromera_velia_CCMP2878 / gene_product=Platelet-activating factor acetylhydrolase 2,, putative / transcript_product=Platelet-activating factor acetylhydrolase 2,, putative / location=Cvel_scaffold1976:4394-6241(+) / protein_length=476 / sequence_SO=supercontig / SO=protein_coding / is_pseudo=false
MPGGCLEGVWGCVMGRRTPFNFEQDGPYKKLGTHTCRLGSMGRARIFYPAATEEEGSQSGTPHPSPKAAPYFLDGRESTAGLASAVNLGRLSFALMALSDKTLTSSVDAPPQIAGGPFPATILFHGITSSPDLHNLLMQQIASMGFVCIAPESPCGCAAYSRDTQGVLHGYAQPPSLEGESDPRSVIQNFRRPQLSVRTEGMKDFLRLLEGDTEAAERASQPEGFLTEWLRPVCDFSRFILSGHSFGGAACLKMMRELDGSYFDGMSKSTGVCIRGSILLDPWPEPLTDLELDSPIEIQKGDHPCSPPLPVLTIISEEWEKNQNRLGKLTQKFHQGVFSQATGLMGSAEGGASLRPFYSAQGSVHTSFSDVGFLAPSFIQRGGNNPTLFHKALSACMCEFTQACFEKARVKGPEDTTQAWEVGGGGRFPWSQERLREAVTKRGGGGVTAQLFADLHEEWGGVGGEGKGAEERIRGG